MTLQKQHWISVHESFIPLIWIVKIPGQISSFAFSHAESITQVRKPVQWIYASPLPVLIPRIGHGVEPMYPASWM